MAEKAKGSGAERRRHPRVPVHGEVMGSIHTVASAPFVDLSETGALLEVTCALKPGSFYRLKFNVPGTGELMIKTRVVRSSVMGFKTGPKGETVLVYRTALEFVELLEGDRKALRRHLGTGRQTAPGALDGFKEDDN
jgi:PilZ domain-containing protein